MKRIIYFFLLFVFAGCETEKIDNLKPDYSESTSIQNVNGMLVFPNESSMTAFIENKNTNNALGFVTNIVTQDDIFNHIVEAESKHYESSETKIANLKEHSDLYYRYLNKGLIRSVKYSDGSQSYDFNLAMPYYAKVLNEEGFFAIGDTIYQVTPTFVKIWMNGDINNYKYLKQFSQTNLDKQIYVESYNSPTTKVLPKNPKDQQVGVQNKGPKYRYMFIFYDFTKPIIKSTLTYSRETYIRVVSQELVGSNTYNYKSVMYDFWWHGNTTNQSTDSTEFWNASTQGTGSNNWHSLYIPYRLLTTGKDGAITYDSSVPYDAIKNYTMLLIVKEGSRVKRFGFKGENKEIYVYDIITQGICDEVTFITELPPM